MEFFLTILGVNGAAPAYGRFPSAQFLRVQSHSFLIDCGEGAQMRLDQYGLPRGKINHIFISHLHGDHILGLPGLLHTYALNERSNPLQIFSPPGLEQLIRPLLGEGLPYLVDFHTLRTDVSELIFSHEELTVHSLPLKHRVPTCGFLFREKPFPLNINPNKIAEFGLTFKQIRSVKQGMDILLPNGRSLPNSDLVLPAYRPRSYAYASDTIFQQEIVPLIAEVDLLYHETTFLNKEVEKAASTMHSTTGQAAAIAKSANVGALITGHYSPRYPSLDAFLEEATEVFPRTVLGMEGQKYEVKRKR